MAYYDKVRVLKRQGKNIYRKNPLLPTAAAILFVLLLKAAERLACGLYMLLQNYLSDSFSKCLVLLAVSALFLPIAPPILRLLSLEQKAENIFLAYRSPRAFLNELKSCVAFAFLFSVLIIVPSCLDYLSELVLSSFEHENTVYYAVGMATSFVKVLSVIPLFGLFCSFLCVLDYSTENTFLSAVIMSFATTKKYRLLFCVITISFIPLFLLTYFLQTIPFLLFAVPYYLCCIKAYKEYTMQASEKISVAFPE